MPSEHLNKPCYYCGGTNYRDTQLVNPHNMPIALGSGAGPDDEQIGPAVSARVCEDCGAVQPFIELN